MIRVAKIVMVQQLCSSVLILKTSVRDLAGAIDIDWLSKVSNYLRASKKSS